MNLQLEKSDLERIGFMTSETSDGHTSFMCNPSSANIEYILLRNVLRLFGEYSIIQIEDEIFSTDGDDFVVYVTNLPWSIYTSMFCKDGEA